MEAVMVMRVLVSKLAAASSHVPRDKTWLR